MNAEDNGTTLLLDGYLAVEPPAQKALRETLNALTAWRYQAVTLPEIIRVAENSLLSHEQKLAAVIKILTRNGTGEPFQYPNPEALSSTREWRENPQWRMDHA